MLYAVLSGFIVALAAPWLYRVAKDATGWILGLLPLGLCIYFLSQLPEAAHGHAVITSYPWMPSLGLTLSFNADGLALLMAILISGIGFMVVVYSGGYLHHHKQLGRWYCFLLMFMASMLGVVLADNLLSLFVFWELTSITSYLLIGFNHEDEDSRTAALQALLVTGLGGLAMLAGLILLGTVGGSYEISELVEHADLVKGHALYGAILILVLAGAFTKSAQFPFHFWLPNAMAAPTPASAYLHSSTMVKAGVYLLARLSPVLAGTEAWMLWVTAFGATTMLVGAYLATQQNILKKLLAYSTVSALGAMVMLLGLSTEHAVQAAVAFLFAHALYKAALFMVAGSVDHETGERDVTKLGGLIKHMPITAVSAGVAGLSMAGIPLFFGFIAKELLYEASLHTHGIKTIILCIVAVLSSMFFLVVSCCVAWKPFYSADKETPKHPHEAPVSMWLGPALLGIGTLIFGLFPGLLNNFLSAAASTVHGEELHIHLALWHGFKLPLLLSAITLVGGLSFYRFLTPYRKLTAPLAHLNPWGPESWYFRALNGMLFSAKWQTKIIQNGYLRIYLKTMLFVLLGLTGWVLLPHKAIWLGAIQQEFLEATQELHFFEVGLAVIMVIAIGMVVHAKTRLGAVAALGVVGYGVALIFVLFGAPDLAMTQIIIETLTVILFILVFYHIDAYHNLSTRGHMARDLVLSIAVGIMMTTLVLVANQIEPTGGITEYFKENSYELAQGRNIVNVILVDFRGIDTLGEITVLAAAAVGAYSLIKLRLSSKRTKEDKA